MEEPALLGQRLIGRGGYFGHVQVGTVPGNDMAGARDADRQLVVLARTVRPARISNSSGCSGRVYSRKTRSLTAGRTENTAMPIPITDLPREGPNHRIISSTEGAHNPYSQQQCDPAACGLAMPLAKPQAAEEKSRERLFRNGR